ncbi:MAG TPA: HutD family protein [Paraburkholderia sp.]|uniref:HutD/Ves family protein n=1 Tax=Paraburkholderia sp. TaxID=1926495 RepID=UPI002B475CBF|nr:HutD family protein [Paraburkholderia sp.]HKR44236.1 HutD family protein [Paraburkholderia sp.]
MSSAKGVGGAVQAARLTLLRGAALVASPWKNGGGVTREIAVAHAASRAGTSLDAFAWRVSVADVAQAGPFSRFEGVDRTLVLLEGAGMLLYEAGRTHVLTQPLDVAHFAGEAAIDARLVNGATRDFNLMVRRDAARGTLEVWRANERRSMHAQTVLLYCAQGGQDVRVDNERHVRLEAGDTLRIDTLDAQRPLHIDTRGAGALLAVALDVLDAPPQHTTETASRDAVHT